MVLVSLPVILQVFRCTKCYVSFVLKSLWRTVYGKREEKKKRAGYYRYYIIMYGVYYYCIVGTQKAGQGFSNVTAFLITLTTFVSRFKAFLSFYAYSIVHTALLVVILF